MGTTRKKKQKPIYEEYYLVVDYNDYMLVDDDLLVEVGEE